MKLTRDMQSAMDLLSERGDRALVRTWSQWWVPESGVEAARRIGPPHEDASGRTIVGAAQVLWDGQQCVTLVRTLTVKALVARNLLKFAGCKRRVLSGAKGVDHWRAELTPAGLSFRAQQVESAADATAHALRKIGGSG